MTRLRPIQERFVNEYLVDLNACAAAIRAGYSPKHAKANSFRLLQNPLIQETITKGRVALSAKTGVTQEMVLERLCAVAFFDSRQVVKWGPDGAVPLPSEEIPDQAAAAIATVCEVRTAEGVSVKVVPNDRMKALELLGKHLGMFVDRTELTGRNGGPLAHTIDDRELYDRIARAARG